MSAQPRRPRTASSIASSVSRRGQGGVRGAMAHQLYMRLTCLEMERHRRGIEREAAMTRVRICDDRSRDIEQEMAEIKAELRDRRMLGEPRVETVDPSAPLRASTRGASRGGGRRAEPGGNDAPVPFKY